MHAQQLADSGWSGGFVSMDARGDIQARVRINGREMIARQAEAFIVQKSFIPPAVLEREGLDIVQERLDFDRLAQVAPLVLTQALHLRR